LNQEELRKLTEKLLHERHFQLDREKEMIEGIYAREGPYFAKAVSVICDNTWTVLQAISVMTHFVPDELGRFISHEFTEMTYSTDNLLLSQAAFITHPNESRERSVKRCEDILSIITQLRKDSIDLLIKETRITNDDSGPQDHYDAH